MDTYHIIYKGKNTNRWIDITCRYHQILLICILMNRLIDMSMDRQIEIKDRYWRRFDLVLNKYMYMDENLSRWIDKIIDRLKDRMKDKLIDLVDRFDRQI